MNEKIIYVGLDVDDQNFHGAAFIAVTGEVIEFKCRPNTKGFWSATETQSKNLPIRRIEHHKRALSSQEGRLVRQVGEL